VPRVLDLEKDERGMVRRLYLNWLRSGGEPLSQLEFARQSLDLLRILHDRAGIIHLDLRLDNVVVTERGVGFVDFGSAVRVGEDLAQSPMLDTLFREMMSTSEIQRQLGRMKRAGKITSPVIADAHHKVDKAVDLFYLSLSMNQPHLNPDFENLVCYDKRSREARALARLTREILKPRDPANPRFKTAHDVLEGLKKIA
jgi:serine/threonine protein kinase